MEPLFLKCTDAINQKEIVLRADLIFKIEECTEISIECRRIQFIDGACEYVMDTMSELLDALVNIQDV